MDLTTIAIAVQMTPVRIVVVGTASSDCSTISCGSVLPAVTGYSREQGQEQASLRAIGVRMTIAERGVVSGAGRNRLQLLRFPHMLCTTSGALDGFQCAAFWSGDQVLGVESVPVAGRWEGGWRK